jgi:hypothetical protein
MYGFGDVAQSAALARHCGWGQKQIDHGPNAPNTCAFDPATALQQAWQIPGVYVGAFGPIKGLSPNAASAIGWGVILAAGWWMFGGRRGRR